MNAYDSYAIITIANRRVHLDTTFNSCAMEPLQIESYASNGWTLCQHCPLLTYAFWSVWCEWNGHMCGGLTLIGNQSPETIDALLSSFSPIHTPSEIATLADGTYLILDHIS